MASCKFFDLLDVHFNLCQPLYQLIIPQTRVVYIVLTFKVGICSLKRVHTHSFDAFVRVGTLYNLQKIYDTFAHFLLLTIINNTVDDGSTLAEDRELVLYAHLYILIYTYQIRYRQTIVVFFFFCIRLSSKITIFFLLVFSDNKCHSKFIQIIICKCFVEIRLPYIIKCTFKILYNILVVCTRKKLFFILRSFVMDILFFIIEDVFFSEALSLLRTFSSLKSSYIRI